MYSVLVSGASGQVGQSLRHVLDIEETPLFSKNSWGFLDRSSLDLSQTDNLSSVIEGFPIGNAQFRKKVTENSLWAFTSVWPISSSFRD